MGLIRFALLAAIFYFAFRWFQQMARQQSGGPKVKRKKGSFSRKKNPPLFDPNNVEDIDYRDIDPNKPEQN